MPSPHPSSDRDVNPRIASLAERGDRFASVQRRLKEEAAERRRAALAGPAKRPATGLSQRSRPGRPTP